MNKGLKKSSTFVVYIKNVFYSKCPISRNNEKIENENENLIERLLPYVFYIQ